MEAAVTADCQSAMMDGLMTAEQPGHSLTGLISALDTQADGKNFWY